MMIFLRSRYFDLDLRLQLLKQGPTFWHMAMRLPRLVKHYNSSSCHSIISSLYRDGVLLDEINALIVKLETGFRL